jgi:hypothetical protein
MQRSRDAYMAESHTLQLEILPAGLALFGWIAPDCNTLTASVAMSKKSDLRPRSVRDM